jgi:precorrin-8X/cobalt-precorrin-8 methylmutase
MPLETVRDNQWWYGNSEHRPRVERCRFVVLSIGGRECPLIHSEVGRDGRPTHSFKFLNVADRDFWGALRGTQVDVEVVECGDEVPDLDQADEANQIANPGIQALEMSPVSRLRETHFDAYIFVDWSASSIPKMGPDSIWIAAGAFDANGTLCVNHPINLATRQQAEANVRELLLTHKQEHRRVLVGFDFPYGYPANWHNAVGLNGMDGNWRTLWNYLAAQINDNAKNDNNRCDVANNLNAADGTFAGPYWSRPNANAGLYPYLPATKPQCFANGVVEFREVERRLRDTGKCPKSVWQLFGNGVVASQALLGIPVLRRIRDLEQLSPFSKVWPFETGWNCPVGQRPFVLHAEIWPGAIPVLRGLHNIKDAAQVLSYVYWAASLDVTGDLGARFNPQPAVGAGAVQQCEGWILGQ